MRHLVYLGNVFHIKDGRITITPMKSRIEAIKKLQAPSTAKACKSFCGVVNYLSSILQRSTENSETNL